MTAGEWAALRRVLLVRMDNIGDVLLLAPVVRAMNMIAPEATLTLLTSPAGAQAVPLLPAIGSVIIHRPLWQSIDGAVEQAPSREKALAERLRSGRFDAAVIFTSYSQSPYPPAFVCYQAGIPLRIGQSKEFGGEILTHWSTPGPDGMHQAERNLELFGGHKADSELRLIVPPESQRAARAMRRASGLEGTYVVLAPGASCFSRRYGRFREVASILDGAGVATLVVGSSKERALVESVSAGLRSSIAMAGNASIPELAGLIDDAAVVIANNSLALHLADGLRTPLVALYSGTDVRTQWEPRRTDAVVLGSEPGCSPCHGFDCDNGMACLNIAPRMVAQAALSLMPVEAMSV